MDGDPFNTIRTLLLAKRDELRREGDFEIEPVLKDPAEKVDEDAAPLTEMNQVIASRRNKNRAMELERIDAALRRLDADPDDFGACEGCGEDIPMRRLEIMPWARKCVKCEEASSPRRGGRRRHAADYLE